MSEQSGSGAHGLALHRATAIASATVLLIVVAGCSSNDNPAPDPIEPGTSAASTTPSETPSPSGAPTLPAQARGTSEKAAIMFAQHVIEVLNYTASSLDPGRLADISTPACTACEAIIDGTIDIRDAGGRIRGGTWSARETKQLSGGSPRFRQVQVVVDYQPQKVIREAGGPAIRHDGGRTVYVFDLRRVDAQWSLSAVRGVQS